MISRFIGSLSRPLFRSTISAAAAVALALAALPLAPAARLLASFAGDRFPGAALHAQAPLDLRSFTQLQAGQEFRIVATTGPLAGRSIGSGKLEALAADRLELRFRIDAAAVQGRVNLRRTGRSSGDDPVLDLNYEGSIAGVPESASENVEADGFLAENGILTFRYKDKQYFFQMSVNRRGENKLVTNWGGGRLEQK